MFTNVYCFDFKIKKRDITSQKLLIVDVKLINILMLFTGKNPPSMRTLGKSQAYWRRIASSWLVLEPQLTRCIHLAMILWHLGTILTACSSGKRESDQTNNSKWKFPPPPLLPTSLQLHQKTSFTPILRQQNI